MSRTPPTKSGSGDFVPCPEGAHNAVVVDVSEPFEQEGKFGKQWKRAIVWQVEETMPPDNVQRFTAMQFYGDSQHPKSNLRPVIVSLLGRELTNDEEGFGVEMDDLIGRPCMIQVVHRKVVKDGTERVYANVTGVLPLPKKMQPLEWDNGWTRWKDREPQDRPEWIRSAKPRTLVPPSADEMFNSAAAGPDADLPF